MRIQHISKNSEFTFRPLISERQNCDAMSSVSSVTDGYYQRGRQRHRSETGSLYSDYGLPPTGLRVRHDSVTSLLSNKSGHELVQGLEEYRARNQEELARERLEAQVINQSNHRLEK